MPLSPPSHYNLHLETVSYFDFGQNGNSNFFTIHFYQFRRAGPQNSAAHQTIRLAAHRTIRLAAHQTIRLAVFTQLFANALNFLG
ncbi:MAG: hypothetical protein AAF587_28700 [Bacteroidota bacterium]